MVVFLFILVMIVGTILLVMASDGVLGRNILRNTKTIEKDAKIVSVKPSVYGSKTSKHYEAVVRFSDGSWYRSQCGTRETNFMLITIQFDPNQAYYVIEKAITAHDKAVAKKELRQKKHFHL